MKMPKVLVCAPTSDKKKYCDADYFSMIQSLSYPNYEILVCDNSKTTDYFIEIKKKHKLPVIRVNPQNKTAAQFIAESYQRLVQEAIRKECYYIMIIESDVIVPTKHIIQRLLRHQLPIVSGMYHIGHGAESHLLLQQLQGMANNFVVVEHLKDGSDMLFVDGSVKEIFACGLGCTLIRVDVFAKTPFRWQEGINHFNDTLFYTDLFSCGIKNHVDTSIVCEHRNIVWDKNEALSTL